MENKFRQGLASQTLKEFDNIRLIREEFIQCDAPDEFIKMFTDTMSNLLGAYIALSDIRKEG